SAELARQGQIFLRAYMWSTAGWLLFQLLRNFVAALERPRIVLWLSLGGIALNAVLSWALIFGHLGLPALELVGGGVGSSVLGLGQAATVRVGLALGRGDSRGISKAGWTAWTLGVGFMGVMALGMWAAPHSLVTLFLRDVPANAVAIALAVSFLKVAAAFQLVDGAQVIGAGMLRGLHDTRWPLLFALVGYWIVGLGIGAWLAFARDWQGVGIWVGLASGLAAVAALMMARWILRDRIGLTAKL